MLNKMLKVIKGIQVTSVKGKHKSVKLQMCKLY